MGAKSQQALNTVLATLFAVLLAEKFDTMFTAPGSRDAFVMAMTVSLGGVFSATLEVGRQLLVRWGTANGIDMAKVLGGIVPLALVVILGGCASGKSIPTSSESSVTSQKVEAKGGAISCESGFVGKMDPTGEWLAELGCAGKLGWTDPPTPEETTGLGQALGTVMKPLSVLAEALARLIPGGP